jgi:crotonobetainyl-CoA:carnitine CoA-transferase CaiB-like acyl-CoA transferase
VDVSLMHVGMWAMSPDIVGAPYMGDIVSYGDRTKAPNPLVNGYATKDRRWFYFVCLQPDRFWDEAPPGPAPELGQHTEEVLLESGMDWDAISTLREEGGLG